ncbi:MAG: Gfo/Idh/MocA family oxidoreductase [Chitinophagales bacterium]|nr:Gfo/Idh/MocA family oxidoreductase [Chitinophagales bacterium]
MYHVALIGYGYWGVNLLRNLNSNIKVSKITVCDINDEMLLVAKKNHPNIQTTKSLDEIWTDLSIDIVVIATPTSTHYSLAKQALASHKHTLVEKPLCTDSLQATELFDLAKKNNKILFCDLTFLYNGAVEYIHNYISNCHIGNIKYIDSTRVNLGIYHADTNVIWDLATHDISIIQKIIQTGPIQVRAISNQSSNKNIDLVYIFLYYPNDMLVQINCSWASPTKIRQMIIGGESKMIIYDDVEPTQKIKIYNYIKSDNDRNSTLTDYRLGDILVPKFSTEEPLKKMFEDFFQCIEQKQYIHVFPNDIIEIIRILEKAEESLNKNGELIDL